MQNKVTVAVVGCGRMGLHHVRAIAALGFAELVGVADAFLEEARARESLPAGVRYFSDPAEMLAVLKPQIVHIVSPPATHVALALLALEHGAHIYVEKPFALTGAEAQQVFAAAQSRGRTVCAGHHLLFQHSGQHYRDYLPVLRRIVHIESYFSFKTVRRVGGGLMGPVEQLVDILPHPVYLMLDAFEASRKPGAATVCELPVIDVAANGEVRALVKQGDTPAVLTVTLSGRPIESYLRVVGTNGSLWVDFVISGITRLLGPGMSAIAAVLNPFIRAQQGVAGTVANVYRMLTRKHKSYAGLAELIDRFHRAVANGDTSPISPGSIIETVRICEVIGEKLAVAAELAEQQAAARLAALEAALPPPERGRKTVLVTGGTGFLGRSLVRELRRCGWPVRVVARRIPAAADRVPGVAYVPGDLGASLPDAVFDGVAVVAHLAAETAGGKEAHERNTIGATRLLLEAAARNGVTRFVHTSSLAVLRPRRWGSAALTESSPVDAGNLGRGPYVWGKAEAERIVAEFCGQHGIEQRQIRLGPLVDYANFTPPGRLGREVGPLFVAMGRPGNTLSVCDVSTAAEVLRYYIENFTQAPPLLNLVEAPQPTRGELARRLRADRTELGLLWLPFPLLRPLSVGLKLVQRLLKPGKKPLDVYSAFASEKYDCRLAETTIGLAKHRSESF